MFLSRRSLFRETVESRYAPPLADFCAQNFQPFALKMVRARTTSLRIAQRRLIQP